MMASLFESEGYDGAMDNWVGRHIRSVSIEALMRCSAPGSKVMDMGCGTGVEAAALTRAGRIVYGFDPSPSMVRAASMAAPEATIVRGSIEELPLLAEENGWSDMDLVYSSLGPLNCVEDLSGALMSAKKLIRRGGCMVFSTMNRYPALEIAALTLTLRIGRARERMQPIQYVRVGDEVIRAHYHCVSDIRSALPEGMKIVTVKALPLLLPPLRTARRSDPILASAVLSSDRSLSPLWPFNRFGDHILFEIVNDDQAG